MPELPEVETVCRGIRSRLPELGAIAEIKIRRRDLRVKIPLKFEKLLQGATLTHVRRRAKYLLFDTDEHTVISHLGMSGSWRLKNESEVLKHDHCYLYFANGERLAFHDPRRFGFIDIMPRGTENESRWIKHLGVEPLSSEFKAEGMHQRAQKKSVVIKSFLMDQKNVVGVGNIYASEALFLAGVRPQRRVNKISLRDWQNIVRAVQNILTRSIEHGGTTLKDYRNSEGKNGEFQSQLYVYGRKGELCHKCKGEVASAVIAGRSTYWCKACQK